MDLDARKRVADRFFVFFQEDDGARLAELLSLSARQIARLRSGESVPQIETAIRMAELLDEARRFGVLTKAEQIERAERVRARHEESQKLTRPVVIDGLEDKEIPLWYANVRRALDEQRWVDGIERMTERRADPDDWMRVPEITKPYILLDLAVCYHKTGRFAESKDAAVAAIDLRERRAPRNPTNTETISLERFLAVGLSNLACATMQMGDSAEAIRLLSQATEHKLDYGPAYYNAICAASLARDEPLLTLKLGELRNAAGAFLSADDIEEILADAGVDKDLVYARRVAIFSEVMEALRAMAARRRAGTMKSPVNPEGGSHDGRFHDG